MVEIIIYIEGVQSKKPSVLTIDNSNIFRENLYQLFSQELSPKEFNLKIRPFGSITKTKKISEEIMTHQSQRRSQTDRFT